MRKWKAPRIACASLVIVAAASGRVPAESPFGDPNAEPAPFNPQMAALMSMLIQPRHAKLGLAGEAENWPLAAYALKELRQGFAVVAKAVPRWRDRPVPELIEAATDHPITLIDYAIKLRYPAQFDFGRTIKAQLFHPWKSGIVGEQFSQIQFAADLKILLARPEVPISSGK